MCVHREQENEVQFVRKELRRVQQIPGKFLTNIKQGIIWRLGLGCSVRNRAINKNELKCYIKKKKAIITNHL